MRQGRGDVEAADSLLEFVSVNSESSSRLTTDWEMISYKAGMKTKTADEAKKARRTKEDENSGRLKRGRTGGGQQMSGKSRDASENCR